MNWTATEPYNGLPELPPQADIESRVVLKATILARAALAGLDQAATSIPNPTVLINSLSLIEAQASSEIEDIVTTTDELFKYAHDESAATDAATREALQYRRALYEGNLSVRRRPMNTSTAVELCSLITRRSMDIRKNPGTFIGNPVTRQAVYTPPIGEGIIRDKLANWESFIHASGDLDPLIVMAVSHYQFEAIHPFEDGNGRTGRVINVLVLVGAGLLSQPVLYLSRYLIQNRSEYYRLLLAVTEDRDWQSWLLFMLEGIRQTAVSTIKKIDEIKALQEKFHDRLRGLNRAGANADLLAVLFEEPYCRIASVMNRCGVSRPTATAWLNGLQADGYLVKVPAGRERLYVNVGFMEILKRDEVVDAPRREPTLF